MGPKSHQLFLLRQKLLSDISKLATKFFDKQRIKETHNRIFQFKKIPKRIGIVHMVLIFLKSFISLSGTTLSTFFQLTAHSLSLTNTRELLLYTVPPDVFLHQPKGINLWRDQLKASVPIGCFKLNKSQTTDSYITPERDIGQRWTKSLEEVYSNKINFSTLARPSMHVKEVGFPQMSYTHVHYISALVLVFRDTTALRTWWPSATSRRAIPPTKTSITRDPPTPPSKLVTTMSRATHVIPPWK